MAPDLFHGHREGCSALMLFKLPNDSISHQDALTVGVCLEAYSMFFFAFGSREPRFLSCRPTHRATLYVHSSVCDISFCLLAPRGIDRKLSDCDASSVGLYVCMGAIIMHRTMIIMAFKKYRGPIAYLSW